MTKDPYEVLGVAKTSSAAEIKKAYRKLARESHPDLHPDDAAAEIRFKEISSAYDLLKDPETRARYDAGEIDAEGVEKPQRRYYRDFADEGGNAYTGGGFDGGFNPDDIFADLFRHRGRGGSQRFSERGFSQRGSDARYRLEVSFMDAVQGAQTQITLPDGSNLSVRLPKGTDDGQTIRLRGKGGEGFGGAPSGDALITISVRPHPVFKREGDDILVTLPITIDEALLGGKVTAPTIDGPVGLTIPAGASSGRVLRLRGRGVSRPAKAGKGAAKTGDQRVELKIVAPPVVDDELRSFMETWRETHAVDPRADILREAGK